MARKLPIEVDAAPGRQLGMSAVRFLRDYWQKRPLLIRNAFTNFKPPLSPNDLAGLACEEMALSRIVVHAAEDKSLDSGFRAARGPGMTSKITTLSSRHGICRSPVPGMEKKEEWDVRTGPFAESEFATLPKSYWTLLLQDVDKWDTDVAALLDHFDFLPSWRIDDVMVSYATDGGGVGAHVDNYDVFLLQGIGERCWKIDIDPDASKECRSGVELKLLQEFHPSHGWILQPGDMLYLPPGVPHEGVAIGECMTFSIGMRAPSTAEMTVDLAEHLAARMPETLRYADSDLCPARDTGEIDDATFARALRALPWLRVADGEEHAQSLDSLVSGVDASLFRTWLGCLFTAYRSAQPASPARRRLKTATLDAKLERSFFIRNPWSRCAWARAGRAAILFVAGEPHPCPLAWARALAGSVRRIDGAQLAGLPSRKPGVALLTALINAGHLRVQRH